MEHRDQMLSQTPSLIPKPKYHDQCRYYRLYIRSVDPNSPEPPREPLLNQPREYNRAHQFHLEYHNRHQKRSNALAYQQQLATQMAEDYLEFPKDLPRCDRSDARQLD